MLSKSGQLLEMNRFKQAHSAWLTGDRLLSGAPAAFSLLTAAPTRYTPAPAKSTGSPQLMRSYVNAARWANRRWRHVHRDPV